LPGFSRIGAWAGGSTKVCCSEFRPIAGFGSAYRSYLRGQHLEFRVEQHLSVSKATKRRFRVEDDVLVDLSAPDLKWRPSVANGIAQRD
jgi:hypothetical protein